MQYFLKYFFAVLLWGRADQRKDAGLVYGKCGQLGISGVWWEEEKGRASYKLEFARKRGKSVGAGAEF